MLSVNLGDETESFLMRLSERKGASLEELLKFAVVSTYHDAEEPVMESEHNAITLSNCDRDRFLEALDEARKNPPKPTEAMERAKRRHRETVRP